jgi:ribonuclease P protein component
MNKYNLPKSHKLKSEKSINRLFVKGKSLSRYPLRVIYHINLSSNSLIPKITFTVSKRNFRRAVDRNLLKRRMREVYRINKQILTENFFPIPSGLEMIFLYTSLEILTYKVIEASLISLLNSLRSDIKQFVVKNT